MVSSAGENGKSVGHPPFTVTNPVTLVDDAERTLQQCWETAHGYDWLHGLAFFAERVRECWEAVDRRAGYTSVTASAFRCHTLDYLRAYLDELTEDITPELDLALRQLGEQSATGD